MYEIDLTFGCLHNNYLLNWVFYTEKKLCRCQQSHHAVLEDNCCFVLFPSFPNTSNLSWPSPNVRSQVSFVSLYSSVFVRVLQRNKINNNVNIHVCYIDRQAGRQRDRQVAATKNQLHSQQRLTAMIRKENEAVG